MDTSLSAVEINTTDTVGVRLALVRSSLLHSTTNTSQSSEWELLGIGAVQKLAVYHKALAFCYHRGKKPDINYAVQVAQRHCVVNKLVRTQ